MCRAFIICARLLVAVCFFSGVAGAQQPSAGGRYYAPLESEPVTLDPALYSDKYSVQVATNLFDGLVEFDQELNVVPAIAKRWKISRDRRVYTFSLREGVKFHHGRSVTAGDFVYSFSRLLDPAVKSPAAAFFMNVKGAKAYSEGASAGVSGLRAPQPLVLEIELEEPFTPFLSILAMSNAKVVPRETIETGFGTRPIGTGPFRFEVWRPGEEIVLSANPDYFAGRPHLDQVSFRIYPNIDWERIFADFQAGRLHHATVPREQYDQLSTNRRGGDYVLVSNPGLNIVYLGMNLGVAPLDDLRVRQAVNYAIDTQTLVKTITKRGSKPVAGILPPGIAGYDPNLAGYGYDPQRARRLLAEAGFAADGAAPIELLTVSKSDNVRQQLEAIQGYLAAVGLHTRIRVADNWKSFVAAINDGQAGLFYAAWYADYPDADNFFFPLTHSSSRTNRMRFQAPAIDRLIEAARVEVDYLSRVGLYREIERQVLDGSPLVSLHVNSNNMLFAANVRGVVMTPMGMMILPLREIYLQGQTLSQTESGRVAKTP